MLLNHHVSCSDFLSYQQSLAGAAASDKFTAFCGVSLNAWRRRNGPVGGPGVQSPDAVQADLSARAAQTRQLTDKVYSPWIQRLANLSRNVPGKTLTAGPHGVG
jgi:hypothetical protein